jgi:16S rRNA (guanine527-N7)-methyltransferase
MVTPREALTIGAKELGITLSEKQVNSFFIYFIELKKWNNKINLTSIRDERDIVIKHGLDSLSFTLGIALDSSVNLLDLGSGAGLPALPIKITYPEVAVTLVESVKKKASFLRHIIRLLALNKIDVIDRRIEELPVSYQAMFNVVTARAFTDMKSVLSIGVPFLKPGGLVILSRGPEETILDHDLVQVGCILEKKIRLILPHSNYKRQIWVFKRIS